MSRAILSVFLLMVFCQDAVWSEERPRRRRACELAIARPLPAGAPRASDVIMRSLRLREGKDADQRDTARALADFHVNRLEWAYIRDRDFIETCRARGVLFGGAASSALAHVIMPPGDSDYAALACVDRNGQPVVPTWKRTWRPPGSWWMCVNNPTLEVRYLEYLESCLDAGAQVMQRDEPGGNLRAVDWGGCFCEHCMGAFREYLAASATADQLAAMGIDSLERFDYRAHLAGLDAPVGDDFRRYDGGDLKRRFIEFQEEATLRFHQRVRRVLNERVGRPVPFSCNNGCRRWTPIELLFDWCFGELSFSHARPDFIHNAMRKATELQRRQVITMPKKRDRENLDDWCRLTRQTIAMAYACGGHCMVPWDVYMPGDAPRYFGTPEQYADLFGFIRANSKYLDGYEYVGGVGPELAGAWQEGGPPLDLLDSRPVCAVLRAIPGRASAPVVVHLVDWSPDPQPIRLSLDPTFFFGELPIQCRLLQPLPYEQTQHQEAEASGSYQPLVETRSLPGGYQTSLQLPAAAPWLLLVIEPSPLPACRWWRNSAVADIWPFPSGAATRTAEATWRKSLFTIDC
jgi:hypothetical protein